MLREAVESYLAVRRACGFALRSGGHLLDSFADFSSARGEHSPLLDPILDEFEAVAQTITYHTPQIALVSCLTGLMAGCREVTHAAYWRRHLRQPVRFADGMATLYAEGYGTFLEIGPHPALLSMGQRCWPPELDPSLPPRPGLWRPSLREGENEWRELLESAAALHVNGVALDWAALVRNGRSTIPYRRVPLPTNPWQQARYWPSNQPEAEAITPNALWQAAAARWYSARRTTSRWRGRSPSATRRR